MRYLLFFFAIFFQSTFVFAQAPTDGSPKPSCSEQITNFNACGFVPEIGGAMLSSGLQSCSNANGYAVVEGVCPQDSHGKGSPSYICWRTCQCSPPSTLTKNAKGETSCAPPTSSAPSECNGEPKVYDPVSGTMVCPGSGDGSSAAASSRTCVVPGDFNGDCVPDDEQNSSANNSTPTSTPPTSSPSSSGSGGGGDDDGDPDTGGGGGGGGGGAGGGSASSASSSPSANASSASGQCDPTSKNYLSCISSQKITPSEGDIPWVPNSGYGNWIPVNQDSPCPNKYKDASGSWWCSGGTSVGGANGSVASGGASGSARSAAGKCDSTSDDYLKCISGHLSSVGSASSVSSANSAASSRFGSYSSLGEKGKFDEELHEKKLEDLTKELQDKIADIKEDVAAQVGGSISASGGIQDFCKNIRGNEVCFGMKKFEPYLQPISNAIFLVCCVLAFVIILRN